MFLIYISSHGPKISLTIMVRVGTLCQHFFIWLFLYSTYETPPHTLSEAPNCLKKAFCSIFIVSSDKFQIKKFTFLAFLGPKTTIIDTKTNCSQWLSTILHSNFMLFLNFSSSSKGVLAKIIILRPMSLFW